MNLSWKQLASIEIGGAICLPVILVGHALCMRYGLVSALTAIAVGNLFLLIVGLLSARLSVANRVSTPEQAQRSFGVKGVQLFALVLMFTKLGWFAIQLTVMSQSVQETLMVSIGRAPSQILLQPLFGVVIVAVALFGLKSISKLSSVSLPLMIVTLLLALVFIVKGGAVPTISKGVIGMEAISVAIAAAITAVLDMPTYFRFARSRRDAIIAVVLLFTVCLPVVETIGVILATYHPEKTLVGTLLGSSLLWNLWMTFFLIIAAWTTINTNIYSASVSLGVLFKNLAEPKRIALLGVGGIALSLLPLLSSFTLVLQVMGTGISAFGGVIYTTEFLKCSWRGAFAPLLAWSLATMTGLMTLFKIFSLTSMPLVDSFFIAALVTAVLLKFQRKKEAAL